MGPRSPSTPTPTTWSCSPTWSGTPSNSEGGERRPRDIPTSREQGPPLSLLAIGGTNEEGDERQARPRHAVDAQGTGMDQRPHPEVRADEVPNPHYKSAGS